MQRLGTSLLFLFLNKLPLGLLVFFGQLAWTQTNTSENWDVVIVPVREEEQTYQIPNDHWPIEISELRQRLDRAFNERSRRQLNPPQLAEAIYVASIQRDGLISERSRWQFHCEECAGELVVGHVSCALTDARNLPEGGKQLSLGLQFRTDGTVQLRPDAMQSPGESEFTGWFGFQSHPVQIAGGDRFDLELPPALQGRMLIATEPTLTLRSPQVVVQAIDSPLEHLPEDWGTNVPPSVAAGDRASITSSSPALGGKVKWWLVQLSGVSNFTLISESGLVNGDEKPQFVVSTADLNYSIDRNRIRLAANFQLAGSSRQPLKIRLHPALRLVSVTMDSQVAAWKSVDASGETNVVQLQSESVGPTSRIELVAVANASLLELSRFTDGFQSRSEASKAVLPGVELVNSIALQGTTGLAAENSTRIKRVISNLDFLPAGSESDWMATTASPSAATSLLSRDNDSEGRINHLGSSTAQTRQQWLGRWVGKPPHVEVEWVTEEDQWDSEALSVFTVRESSVSADAHFQWTGWNLTSNSIVFPVLGNWVVDRAHATDDSDELFRVQVVQPDIGPQQIKVFWQHAVNPIRIRMDVRAHLRRLPDEPRRDPKSPFMVDNTWLLEMPSGTHSMNYVVTEESGYRLRFRPDLLQMIQSRQDLPDWQQDLLPVSNSLVFGDYIKVSGDSPRNQNQQSFQMDLQTGTFSAFSATLVERSNEYVWQSSTQIHCQALSGSVDRIPVVLEDQRLELWKIHWVDEGGLFQEVQPTNIRKDEPSSRTEFDLILPTPASSRFTLRFTRPLSSETNDGSSGLQLVIPGLPTSQDVESLLILPNPLSLDESGSELELLASGSCCEPGIADAVSQLLKGESVDSFLVARVNGTSSQRLILKRLVHSAQPENSSFLDSKLTPNPTSTWIWSEVIHHQLDDSGAVTHEIQLDVHSQAGDLLSLHIPEHLQLQMVFGIETSLADQGSSTSRLFPLPYANFVRRSGLLQIAMPGGERNQLIVRLTSQHPKLGWLSSAQLHAPGYDVPVLQRLHSVQMSPKFQVLNSTLETETSDTGRVMKGTYLQSPLRPDPSTTVRWRDRWLSGNWWRWLLPVYDETPVSPGWTTYELPPPSTSNESVSLVRVIDRHALTSFAWAFLILLSWTSWLILRSSLRFWWLMLSLAIGLNALMPVGWLVASQMTLMAVMGGCLVYFMERIIRRPTVVFRKIATSRTSVAATCLYLSLSLGHAAQAQSNQSSVESPPIGADNYRIFIPSDETGQPSGEFAYISKQLRDRLYSTQPQLGQESAGSILSALYNVKLRHDERDSEPVINCTVDWRLSINQANVEILIPITGNGITWTGTPLLDGQPRIWGGRNFTLTNNDTGVLFRADSTGVVQLSLQFSAKANSEADRRFGMLVNIPPIANAKLRVNSSGSVSNLNIEARGLVQRNFLGETNANLGPVDKLGISWSITPRPASIAPPEQVSETWLKAQGKHVMAACLLTVGRSQLLPREFDLIINGDWQPIGEFWRDVDLVSRSTSGPFQGRTVFRVRRRDFGEESLRIQVMLIPNSPTPKDGLAAPFISLDRVNTKATYFWWSSDRDSQWLPEVLDSRPVREDNLADWAFFGSNLPRMGYQVFSGSVLLRHQTTPAPNLPISETHSLRLRRHQTILDYSARWEPTGNPPETLLIDIPRSLMPPELEINGAPAKFRLDDNRRLMMISMKENGVGRLGRLKLHLELPAVSGRVDSVPRVSIWKGHAKQSIYELYSGVDTQVQVLESNDPIAFEVAENPLSPVGQLMELDRQLGQANLSTLSDTGGHLPLKLEVRNLGSLQPDNTVLLIDETREGWRATVRCQWDDPETLPDFVFFDLPFSARDGLNAGTTAFKFMPHSDPSRTNLCLPTSASKNGGQGLEFSFPISASLSSRSVSIPWIRTPDLDRLSVVGLPKSVGGKPARWMWAGRQLGESSQEVHPREATEELYFFSIPQEINSVVWQAIDDNSRATNPIFSLLDITHQSSSRMVATLHYWIEPNGLVKEHLFIPGDCSVLGVKCNGRKAQWSLSGRNLEVILQPNSLPLELKILLQWTGNIHNGVEVPALVSQGNQLPGFVKLPAGSEERSLQPRLSSVETYDQVIANRWAEAIVAATSKLPNLPGREVSLWLTQWNPESMGVPPEVAITQPNVLSSTIAVDINNDQRVTVGELWKGLAMIVETTLDPISEPAQQTVLSSESVYFHLDDHRLFFSTVKAASEPNPITRYHWYLGLAGMIVLGMSPWLFGRQLPKLKVTPWLDWFLLAGVLVLLIPTLWPSLILTVVGIVLAILHFKDSQNSAFRG